MVKRMVTVTQATIDAYVALDAEIKQRESEKKGLREEIVPWLESGRECPAHGPYILKLSQQEQAAHSWKDICDAVLMSLKGPVQEQAQALVSIMLEDKKIVSRILVAPNAAFMSEYTKEDAA